MAELSQDKKSQEVLVFMLNTVANTFLIFTHGQIDYLQDHGFEIVGIASQDKFWDQVVEREKIQMIPVTMTRDVSPWTDLVGLLKIWWLVITMRPRLVHGSTPKAGLLSMWAALLGGVKARLFFLRGLRFIELSGWKRTVVRLMEKFTCMAATQVLATSPSVMKMAIESGICNPEKIKVLHNGSGNGIDSDHYNPSRFSEADIRKTRESLGLKPGDQALLFAGRIVRDKGVVELGEAWKTIRHDFPKAHLVLAGYLDSKEPQVISVQEEFSRDPRVKILGWVNDPAPLYAAADVLVHPTYREGIPITVLEASAMELPIVATRVVGCVDAVIDGENGILVEPKSSEPIARAVSTLLTDPVLRKKMGQAGRARVVRDFKPQDVWESLRREYIALLERTNSF